MFPLQFAGNLQADAPISSQAFQGQEARDTIAAL
jgi:hypothetical protein